ncbi:MAG: CubicO group peptidase (beta-lactamase class C family) [Woeseiaceae bacterium]|jgi:CubicO group peptidase (beta-lactamase class C family)
MKNNLVTIFVSIFVCLLPLIAYSGSLKVYSPESVGMSSERLQAFRNYFADLVDDERSGGYQLLVARRGKVVMHDNLGMAKVAENVPVSDDTLFRIFSMTKPIVGVAMMMLYEEGYYSLADPISKHLPELKDLMVYAGEDDEGNVLLEKPEREPTIHDLMQHTAGFTYGIFGDTAVDAQYRDKDLLNYDNTMAQNLATVASIPLLYQPGKRWVYSVSVDIQAYLIERITGMEVGEFLQERIFDPLKMDETIVWVPPKKAELLAHVYTHDEDGKRAVFEGSFATNAYRAPGTFSGGGQLISTSDDYLRFCQMLLNGGELDGKRYLSPRTVSMMTTNRLSDDIAFRPGEGFGLNFGVVTDATQVGYAASNGEYHWGGLANTVFWIDPQEEMIVIMMSQYLPHAGDQYRDMLHRLVRAAIIE